MNFIAPRTCRIVRQSQSAKPSGDVPVPLAEFAQSRAYVLIGEPGTGKTTALKTEEEAHGGVYLSVRDFLTFDRPQWHGQTLYLDGLDEMRAGAVDGRLPLEQVLAKLDRLGCPPFRLSCRWADWLGASDRDRLDQVSVGTLTVLQLDPLSKRDVKRILVENHGVADPKGFIAGALRRGIGGLLTNPQNLDLLATAVSGGNWPGSRLETFEFACRMLVSERNSQHSVVNSTAGSTESLLDEAGRLCAVQILAGLAGYTQQGHVAVSADYPPVPTGDTGAVTSRIVQTRLFAGANEGRQAPAHRQIAEFLAARHVSRLIDDGLPLQRVLALITGFDGELVRPFGNFAAWLGVHNRPSRKQLSRLNPGGMFYVGGPDTFFADERRDILVNLRREARWNRDCLYTRRWPGLGPLVSVESQDACEEILTTPERRYPNQPHVMMVLQALGEGDPLPDLVPAVLQLVRDPSWLPGVRCAALDILIEYRKRKAVQTDLLVGLLGDIDAGKAEEPVDDLLGILLKALYPGNISIAEALKYLRFPKSWEFSEQFLVFWTKHVPAESTDEQRAELLDAIAANFGSFRSVMIGESNRHSIMGQLPAKLLSFRLRSSMDDIPIEHLWTWLCVASHPGLTVLEPTAGAVSLELERNEDRLKELLTYGVEWCASAEDTVSHVGLMERALFRTRLGNFGRWLADRALSATTELAAAIYIDLFADQWVRDPFAVDLTREQFRERLRPNPVVVALFDERVKLLAHPHDDRRYFFLAALIPDTEAQTKYQGEIEAESAQLQAGYGSPSLLERAAHAYFCQTADAAGESPGDRLGRLVGSRTDLAAHLRSGLLGVPARDDLPTPSNILARYGAGAMPPLTFPFMAALYELDRSGQLEVSGMSDRVVDLAVTILHSVPADRLTPDPHGPFRSFRPQWLSQLLQGRPRPIADALTRAIRRKLAMGVLPASEVWALADQDHRGVAALACLPLLRTFPTESGEAYPKALGWLLTAALKSCNGKQLERTIRHRLVNEEVPEAQRIYWVLAGFLLAPGRYGRELQRFGNRPDRPGSLLDFLCRVGLPREFANRLDASELRLLISMTRVAKEDTPVAKAGWSLTSGLLWRLLSLHTHEAADLLEELRHSPAFAEWDADIALAIDFQLARRREADFRHSAIELVTKTLGNGRPANARDLAALVAAELEVLSLQIRDSSASYWKHFWNVDKYNRARGPRPEKSCRDAILFGLQARLARLGIDVQPEGTYADDKRADIRVAFGGFNVPVEIKRACHPDLWTAIGNQLVLKYTRDPGSAGFGIYLVLWFGQDNCCKPTALDGWVPANAGDLKQKLTEMFSGPERSRISVSVMDVSKPNT